MPTTDELDARIDELEQQMAKTVSINQVLDMIKTTQVLIAGYEIRLAELEEQCACPPDSTDSAEQFAFFLANSMGA
jgi:hypothetical protein